MPLSAREVYDAAQLTPSFFGTAIDFSASDEEQLAQALAYIDQQVLPSARAEISLPVRRVLNDVTSPLDDAGIDVLFGGMSDEVKDLWNVAELSFARSELNKRVASSTKTYDQDSDQDRIQGNQRRQELLEFLKMWLALSVNPESVRDEEDVPQSQKVRARGVW